MMEDEVVGRRRWMTREQFLDYVGATNLIPGPNSTELAIHIGHARAGWPGLLVAGVSFITPATLIVTAVASAYVRYGALPDAARILYGIKPVVIAIVAHALWRLGRSAVKSAWLALLRGRRGSGAGGRRERAVVLLLAGCLCAAGRLAHAPVPLRRVGDRRLRGGQTGPGDRGGGRCSVGDRAGGTQDPVSSCSSKSARFSSGALRAARLPSHRPGAASRLAERTALLDAAAVGQLPGPVFDGHLHWISSMAPRNQRVATIGIFLPAFVFVALSGPARPAHPALTGCRSRARRRERGFAGAHGAGHVAARSRRVAGRAHGLALAVQPGSPDVLARQLRVVDPGRWPHRVYGTIRPFLVLRATRRVRLRCLHFELSR